MFGASNPFGQPSNSPFGSPSVFGQTSNANNNPFAPKPFGSTSPFGAQTGGSVFGGTSTGVFGTQASSPVFGVTSAPAFGASSSPAFGASSTSFGSSSVFGQSPSFGGFGSTTQSSPFGSSFQQQSQPAFGTNLFGSSTFGASTQPAFGAPSTPAFGAPSTPAFGSTSTPTFGSTGSAFGVSSTSVFGSSTPAFGSSPTPAFGATSSPFSFGSSPAFGQSTSAFGSSPFGSTTTAFGAPSSPFGGQSTTPAFGSPVFGQPSFGSQRGGSRVTPYAQTPEADSGSGTQPAGKLESISAMPVYKEKSHEEIRWEDYQLGDKGGPNPAAQSSSGMGFNITTNTQQTNPFASTSPANPFSSSTSSNLFAPKTPTFGTSGFGTSTPLSSSPFGSTPTPTQAPSIFGSTASSLFGTGSSSTFGTSTSVFGTGLNFGSTQSSPLFQSTTPTLGQTSSPFGQSAPAFGQSNAFNGNLFLSTSSLLSTGFNQTPSLSNPFQSNPNPGGFGFANQSPQTQPITNPFGTLPAMPQMSIQYGISSLPVVDKAAPVRISTVLTSRHLSQRRIRLPARKYHPKNDSSKVSFFSDEEDTTSTPKADALFIPRENPRALVIRPMEQSPAKISVEKPKEKNASSPAQANGNHYENGTFKEQTIPIKVTQKTNGTHEDPKSDSYITLTGHRAGEAAIVYEHGADIETLMPKLRHSDYYTEPRIQELAAKERAGPGFCRRVSNFVVGRHNYGNIKFFGETDVRRLDLESLVQFNHREVIVYMDESKKPPVGQGLNKPAEVTLLNIKCVDKKTGRQLTEGPRVEKYKDMLRRKAEDQGAEFVSFDPVKGEWKFRVSHFSRYGLEDAA